MTDKTIDELQAELESLKQELKDRKDALPAHSVRPSQMMEIEELEDKIKTKTKEIENKK